MALKYVKSNLKKVIQHLLHGINENLYDLFYDSHG